MAADQYSSDAGTYGQPDMSNGDWWTQNQPPPPAWIPAPGYEHPNQPPQVPAGTPGSVTQPGIGPGGTDLIFQGQLPEVDPTNTGTVGGGLTWGGPVAPYEGSYPGFTPPPLPDYLQKGFQLPSAAELQATPGYMERFRMGQQARERAAAARGTILNGGTQQALTRYGQDYASGEYSNLANQKLSERQQQSNDYLNLAYGPSWQQNQAAVNQYGQLYRQYQDNIGNNRSAQGDYWQQQIDLLNAGLGAAKAGAVGTGGA